MHQWLGGRLALQTLFSHQNSTWRSLRLQPGHPLAAEFPLQLTLHGRLESVNDSLVKYVLWEEGKDSWQEHRGSTGFSLA